MPGFLGLLCIQKTAASPTDQHPGTLSWRSLQHHIMNDIRGACTPTRREKLRRRTTPRTPGTSWMLSSSGCCRSRYRFINLSVWYSIHPPSHLPIHTSIQLSVYRSIYLSACLPYLPTNLPTYLTSHPAIQTCIHTCVHKHRLYIYLYIYICIYVYLTTYIRTHTHAPNRYTYTYTHCTYTCISSHITHTQRRK